MAQKPNPNRNLSLTETRGKACNNTTNNYNNDNNKVQSSSYIIVICKDLCDKPLCKVY